MQEGKLVVGLGNPGARYDKTRHNMGFMVVKAFADKYKWLFHKKERVLGLVAEGEMAGFSVTLLLPTTFMNLSGGAVRKAKEFYKLRRADLLVVVDDIYIPVGSLHLRPQGGARGHNGLRDIDKALGCQEYSRLSVGVGPKDKNDLPDGSTTFLEEYVLSPFPPEESVQLPKILEEGVRMIECWLAGEHST